MVVVEMRRLTAWEEMNETTGLHCGKLAKIAASLVKIGEQSGL